MWDLVKRRTHIELTIIAKPAMSMALLQCLLQQKGALLMYWGQGQRAKPPICYQLIIYYQSGRKDKEQINGTGRQLQLNKDQSYLRSQVSTVERQSSIFFSCLLLSYFYSFFLSSYFYYFRIYCLRYSDCYLQKRWLPCFLNILYWRDGVSDLFLFLWEGD